MAFDKLEQWETRDCNSSFMSGDSSRCSTTHLKDGQETPAEKSKRLWAMLRKAITSTVMKMKKSDLVSMHLTHGIEHQRHINTKHPVRQVVYIHGSKGFVSLDAAGRIHLHQPDGHVEKSIEPDLTLSGLLVAPNVNQYVAWDSDHLNVLSADFSVISTVHSSQVICCATYNMELNELVTGGAGYIATWRFRFGSHKLVSQKVMTQGFDKRDVVSMLALEKSLLQSQRCFAVCDNGVMVFNLCDGALLTSRRDLHMRSITGILYSDAAKLLVTSSLGSSIKVWDENWNIRTIFVGHTGPITALALYHTGTLFFSASLDSTIRTWDLETADQIDEVRVKEGVLGLVAHGEGQSLVSYSNCAIDTWQIIHLYDLYSMIGSPVTEITTVDLSQIGSFPIRAVCVGMDSTIRLLAVETGEAHCTLLLDRPTQVAAAEYCLPRETLFVLTEQGDLLKVNALTNPMTVIKQLSSGNDTSRFSCLTLYSFIVDFKEAFTYWRNVVEEKRERRPMSYSQLSVRLQEKNRYLLIAGSEDGTLSVFEWYTLRVQCQVKAHDFGKVTKVISSPQNNCIISAGSDLAIKVWHVFPHAEECLSLDMTFYCSYGVARMCTMASLLIVAFEDPSTANYSIVQYNLRNKNRADHRPGDDPHDKTTGLCCCPRLKLVASASRDGSVKIWNEENRLVRHLNLSMVPESLAFSSNQVDLLVGIQRHIYRIDLAKLLPILYQVKLACVETQAPVADPPIPVLETTLKSLSKDSLKRLLDPHSAINRSEVALLQKTAEEQQIMRACAEEKEKYSVLAARDQELLLIKQGKLHCSKKPKRTEATEKEAFGRYLQIFYRDKPRLKITPLDHFDCDDLLMPPQPPPMENPYHPEKYKGFFPNPLEAMNQCIIAEIYQKRDKYEKLPIPPYGFIPNSVLVRLLWPMQILHKQFEAEKNLCPEPYTAELQAGVKEGIQSQKGFVMVEDDEIDLAEEKERDSNPTLLHKTSSTSFTSFHSALARAARFPDHEDTSSSTALEDEEEASSSRRKASRLMHSRSQRPSDFKITLPPLIEGRPSAPVEIKAKSPPAPPTPSPVSPAPTPIPNFILQFQHEGWFTALFPDFGPQTFPKDITVSKFVSKLLQGMTHVNFKMKVGIIDAILRLHEEGGFENVREVHDALISSLNPKTPLDLQVQEQLNFILATLRALKILDCNSKDLALELMTFFQQATLKHRTPLMALFEELGLQDRHGHFYEEMDSWETWQETDGSKASMKDFCNRWLNEWIEKLQDHVANILQGLPKKPQDGRQLPARKKSRGCKEEAQTQGAPVNGTTSQSLQSKKVRASQGGVRPGGQPAFCLNLVPVEAINFFCQMQDEKARQALKPVCAEEKAGQKDTVLALPPLDRCAAILRLGETHSMTRTRKRECFYLPPVPQEHFLTGFGRYINFPVKKINLNPFPSIVDLDYAPNLSASLSQMAHRYFFLDHSITESYAKGASVGPAAGGLREGYANLDSCSVPPYS
ncbi:WD repeat-containing protein 97 [Ambystoma mexicanum]|uniref:WD repeat-containing protein 97 n=1 Tax=Ambystoma mexicanum TaxID=8296 RepID=UPI0037E83AD0